jgi:misacylated tRNA(Ala) deacylase
VFVYRADRGLDWINLLVAEVKDNIERAAVVVLASRELKKGGPLVIVGADETVAALTKKITQEVREVNGEGEGRRWRGKVTGWHKGELEALRKAVEVEP